MLYHVKISYKKGRPKSFYKEFSKASTMVEYKSKKLSNKNIENVEVRKVSVDKVVKKRPNRYNVSLEKQIVAKKRALTSATCIYALIKGEEVVYIGQSMQPMGRIQAHIVSSKEFDGYAVVEWIETSEDSEFVNRREKEYIRELKPMYNIVHNK